MNVVLTTCPYCACGCGLYLHAQDGRSVGVTPSEHHPVSRGRLCARGWNAHEAPAWGERLTHPLIRRGASFAEASWAEALDEAASRLSKLAAAGRPVGVLGSARATNEENYLATRLARAALHTPHIDSCLRSTWKPLPVRGTFDDVERCGVVLLIEGDVARSHPAAAHAVMLAVKRGARLVTIGSRETQMARIGHLRLRARPGSLASVLERLVVAAEKPDAESDSTLVQAAGWLREAGGAAILYAPASAAPEATARETESLARLVSRTGHLERAGSAVLYLAARGNLRGACEMGVAPEVDPSMVAPLRRAWGQAAALEQGLDAATMVDVAHGLLIVADDPAAVLLDGARAAAALQAKECVVTLDAFMTPAVKAAHVVLPIASFAENSGTVTNLEGRVQETRPAARPPGEARQGWEVLGDLSARLGLPTAFASAEDVLREIASVVPGYDGERDHFSPGIRDRLAQGDADPGTVAGSASTPSPPFLILEGVFDWGRDPLVRCSPTLSRDHVSRHKLFPRGFLAMSKQDAEQLGVRSGWTVRVASSHGEAILPVSLRPDLDPGVLMVPYAFRDHVGRVLAGASEVAVHVEKTA